MPKRIPKYRLHRSSGLALVEIRGRRIYLGAYGTPESREKYHRLLAEEAAGNRREVSRPGHVTVHQLVLEFWRWAKVRYVKHGQPTTEIESYRVALSPVVALYGSTPACDFGPLALRCCRERLVDAGYCRKRINGHISRIRSVWKWGVSRELVPETVHRALQSVAGLRPGESKAPERHKIRPAPESDVAAALSKLTPHLAAMVNLQLWTAMRPGEVCAMRSIDIQMSGKIWTYTPAAHKTEHHGKSRVIFIGPQAQDILRQWLRPELDAYLFQPRESREWHLAQRRAARQTPMTPSQARRRRVKRPERRPGAVYSTLAYGHAIARACRQAGVPRWSPNQLRHNAGTRIRAAYGIEAARIILGHASAVTSEIYAEIDAARASEIVAAIG